MSSIGILSLVWVVAPRVVGNPVGVGRADEEYQKRPFLKHWALGFGIVLDNGPELSGRAVDQWAYERGVRPQAGPFLRRDTSPPMWGRRVSGTPQPVEKGGPVAAAAVCTGLAVQVCRGSSLPDGAPSRVSSPVAGPRGVFQQAGAFLRRDGRQSTRSPTRYRVVSL